MHGKDARTEELNKVKLYILASFGITFRAPSAVQNGSALMLLKFVFKTFKININKSRYPVEIYDMYSLLKLQSKNINYNYYNRCDGGGELTRASGFSGLQSSPRDCRLLHSSLVLAMYPQSTFLPSLH